MLPKPHHSPSHPPETATVATVTLDVRFNLQLPLGRQLVPPTLESPAVPEPAINEHRDLRSPEHKIGPAGKVLGVRFKFQRPRTESEGHDPFGTGITSAYPRHQSAALFRGHDVAAMKPFDGGFLLHRHQVEAPLARS